MTKITIKIPNNQKSEQPKILKIKLLFQIMYYNLPYGRQSTHFHVMIAKAIYEKCRSKEIITNKTNLDYM